MPKRKAHTWKWETNQAHHSAEITSECEHYTAKITAYFRKDKTKHCIKRTTVYQLSIEIHHKEPVDVEVYRWDRGRWLTSSPTHTSVFYKGLIETLNTIRDEFQWK